MTNFEKITVEEAERRVIEGDLAESFAEWLKEAGKAPFEWTYDDLGDFFREKGFNTI